MLARNAEGTRISRPRMALNTLKGIHKEMARVYRLSLAGALPSAEMTRLIFGLRELRQTVEAQAEAATLEMPAGSFTTEINVYAIPHGVQFSADGQTLIWPETGAPADPLPLVPYTGTPALEMLADQTRSSEPPRPLPIIEVDAANVTPFVRLSSR